MARSRQWLIVVAVATAACRLVASIDDIEFAADGGVDGSAAQDGSGFDGPAADSSNVFDGGPEGSLCTANVGLFDGYVPDWQAPHVPQPGACTPASLENGFIACGPACTDSKACGTYSTTNQSCFNCLVGSGGGTAAAVLYDPKAGPFSNMGACIATQTTNPAWQYCGPQFYRVQTCARAACSGCVVGACVPSSEEAYYQCLQDALLACSNASLLDAICTQAANSAPCQLRPSASSGVNQEHMRYLAVAPLLCP